MSKNEEIVKAHGKSIEPLKVRVIEEEDGSVRCEVVSIIILHGYPKNL